jgi:antagonist of KipI
MSILIQRPGILTTVQDLGRHGYRRLGINPGGAMDRAAVRLLNRLLGSGDNDAVLEMHFSAPQILFRKETIIAIGGADFDPRLDNRPIPAWSSVRVDPGSILTFAAKKCGNRAYLAIKSGFDVDAWLDSTATNLRARIGGFSGRRLEKGDEIQYRKSVPFTHSEVTISPWFVPNYSPSPRVKILPGGEFHKLSEVGRKNLLDSEFEVSGGSDRMGFRLSGPPVQLLEPAELLSSAVEFGTIQSLPDGQMIMLMADHQTTGGYPRLAHVISRDVPLVAQLGPGDKVSFELISQEEAEKLSLELSRHLKFLRVGSRF